MNKHYYVGHSYMGTNYTYESPCWVVYSFDSYADRKEWLNKNWCNDQGNRVAQAITRKEAFEIIGFKKGYETFTDCDNRLFAMPRY